MSYTIEGDIAQFNAIYGAAASPLERNLEFLFSRQLGATPERWQVQRHGPELITLLPAPQVGHFNRNPGQSCINPYAVFARAAALTYEAFAADTDDSDDTSCLLISLQNAAESANRLAKAWRPTEQKE